MTEIIIKTNGGKRTGAGRKEGTGKFGEPTSVLRIPASQTVARQLSCLVQRQLSCLVDADIFTTVFA